jgi:hypothetical protein
LDIGTIVFNNQNNSDDMKLLEAASAAMRAILQQLADVHANIFQQLTISDILPMLNNTVQYSNANIRINMIRMLCDLVQILINKSIVENYEVIKVIVFLFFKLCN